MISAAVYITSDEARVFKFNASGVETHQMHRHGPKHHTESLGKNHSKEQGDAEHFFHEVAEFLIKDEAERWLIIGPGLAKTHFKSHVERHHSQQAKRIVGVEAMDKATDGEITHFAHGFFKKMGLFEGLN